MILFAFYTNIKQYLSVKLTLTTLLTMAICALPHGSIFDLFFFASFLLLFDSVYNILIYHMYYSFAVYYLHPTSLHRRELKSCIKYGSYLVTELPVGAVHLNNVKIII